jgi:hypothetical protein
LTNTNPETQLKSLIALLLIAASPALVVAQSTTTKPAAKAAAKPAPKKPAAPRKPTDAEIKAQEEATPLEEPDPTIKLSELEVEMAKKVHVGEFPCELGAKIRVRALRRDGFFLVSNKLNRFVMHPVESRTGAIRLEDPIRGALMLQLGNKSMLMSQKLGQRLADECQSPEQEKFAAEMKNKPPVNLLEANPAQSPTSPKGGPN